MKSAGKPRLFDRMGIRHHVALMTGIVIFITCALFGWVNYLTLERELLNGVDAKLRVSAYLASQVPPKGYFDHIQDPHSVSPEAYDRIVAENNRLCLELGLQYLWSCMAIGDKIHFTTSTSPSKDVTKGDHATFFDVHGDPHAFHRVFGTMKPDYSSFHNEWGHGRMVLIPDTDSHGRKYCYGASMSINEVDALLRRNVRNSVLISLLVLLLGVGLSVIASRSVSRPIERLTEVARGISEGDLDQEVNVMGSREIRSLSQSIEKMSESIGHTITALQKEVEERIHAQAELQSHRDHLEELVELRTGEVRHANEELERSNKELQQFAYVVSHDLQEPLRMVASYLQLLERRYKGKLDASADDFIHFAVDGALRMKALIESMLHYSRVQTKGKPPVPVETEPLLKSIIQNMEVLISEKRATITHDPLPRVMADEVQLGQVFQNLIGNALKFSGEEPPKIHITATSNPERGVRNGESKSQMWTFSVSDNGIGIEPEFKERIFQIFQRLHPQGEFSGTGIGLAICKKIVERHEGRIWVESEEGKGATFWFTLGGAGNGNAE